MGSAFKSLHRWTGHAFTRVRSLTFEVVLAMVLRKSVKSLQNVANEAMSWLGIGTVTASAIRRRVTSSSTPPSSN